ncbi:hypothetical protein V3N99_08115 [Dermatophilaceae bacterium Soc4.6]
MTGQDTFPAHDTWREVIALLVEAADRGYRQAATTPALHSTALWAHSIAAAATGLLPPELDHLLDDVVLGAQTTGLDMVGLIQVAETATRRHPIEQFPPGATGVVIALCDLVREARA